MRWLVLAVVLVGCGGEESEPLEVRLTFTGDLAGRKVFIDGVERTAVVIQYPDGNDLPDVTWELRNDADEVLRTDSMWPWDIPLDPFMNLDDVYSRLYAEKCLVPWGTWRDAARGFVLNGMEHREDLGCVAGCDPTGERACEQLPDEPARHCRSLGLEVDPRYHELACILDLDPVHQPGDACSPTAHVDGGYVWDDCGADLHCHDGVCRAICSPSVDCATTCVTPVGQPPELTICLP